MRLVARTEALDREAFDQVFSKVPEWVRVSAADRQGLPPAVFWRRLLTWIPAGAGEFWLLLDAQGEVLGRVGATLSGADASAGYVGFFEVAILPESAEKAAGLLLEAACAWLRAQGRARAIGPIVGNTWFPYRYRVDPVVRRFAWEPVHPPVYPQLWRGLGFEPDALYHTDATRDVACMAERLRPSLDAVVADGFTLRDFDPTELERRELPALYRLSMQGFDESYLFEPVPFEVFRELYVPLVTKVDLSISHFLVNPEGKEVGFLFSFLDRDPVSDELALVLKSVALDESCRGRGRSNALVCRALEKAQSRGATLSISALIREGNRSASYTRGVDFAFRHEYRLFARSL